MVYAVMLTADRQQYTERAIGSFLCQTHPHRYLFILDTGQATFLFPERLSRRERGLIHLVSMKRKAGQSLGDLRNTAAFMIGEKADVLMHWDSDDWSAPDRMAAQVAVLLRKPELELTGFDSMYFYRKQDRTAWRYHNVGYLIGTSLAYTWQAWHDSGGFPSLAVGEDTEWQKVIKHREATSSGLSDSPLMIAELHEGSTLAAGTISRIAQTGDPRTDVWHSAQEARDMLESRLGYGVPQLTSRGRLM